MPFQPSDTGSFQSCITSWDEGNDWTWDDWRMECYALANQNYWNYQQEPEYFVYDSWTECKVDYQPTNQWHWSSQYDNYEEWTEYCQNFWVHDDHYSLDNLEDEIKPNVLLGVLAVTLLMVIF